MLLASVRLSAVLLLTLLFFGCASGPTQRCAERPFDFDRDTFSFTNETVWEYGYDHSGRWRGVKRSPKPEYSLHCVPVSRSARQFFEYAVFDPLAPKAAPEVYRKLARRVTRIRRGKEKPEIVIPGYASLREFSSDHAKLLQDSCGGAWQSYFQRGNWRMVFPFSRAHQRKTADRLVDELRRHCPPVLHVLRFPQLSVNHTVLVIDYLEWNGGIIFVCYDPNDPTGPIGVNYDFASGWFHFPQTKYFRGGRVNAYQIYTGWLY